MNQDTGLQWPYHPLPGKQTEMWESMAPDSDLKFVGYGGGRGSGKASKNSSLVATPFGFRKMGDLQVGDKICDTEGSVQRVLQVHPQGEKDIYRVKFATGATTYVTLDHLWTASISNRTHTRKGESGTYLQKFTTKQLKEHLDKVDGFDNPSYPLVPLPDPVNFTKTYPVDMRPIDPYLLGLLLGDGCITGTTVPSLVSGDDLIIDWIRSHCKKNEWKYSIRQHKENCKEIRIKSPELVQGLTKIGLHGLGSLEKLIPKPYLYNTVENRIRLMQGLMDTDGYVDSEGHMSYTSISKKLSEGVQWIVRSLGGKATVWSGEGSYKNKNDEKVVCNDHHTVQFNTKMNPDLVRLPRKKERAKYIFNGGNSDLKLRMESIEFSHREKATCITVSNKNSLYITDDFIVTHNSFGMRSWFVTACWHFPIKATIIRKSRADLRDNHINPFKAEMRDYIDEGYIKFNERDAAAYFKNGSILKFGYCNKPEDLENIQGQAYDLMGIEESTQLDELYLRKMFAACRGSEISDGTYKNKILMTFNWGAASHEYHRRIFWDEEYNEYERPEKYHFIWANVDDNPALLAKTPDYKEQLAATLDEQMRKAWIDGDPDAFSGTVFNITDLAHLVDPTKTNVLGRFNNIVPNNWKVFGSVDVGTNVCAFGLYCKTPGGNIFKMFSYYGKERNPQDHVEAIVDRIRNYGYTDGRFPAYVLADRRAFAQIGKHQIHSYDTTWEDLFRDYGIYLRRANDKREQGFMALKSALGYKYDDSKHELITHPKLRFFKGTNDTTVNHLKAMQLAENNKEDIDQNLPDHDYDETRYAIMGALTPSEQKKQDKKDKVDPESDYGRNKEDHDLIKQGVGLGSGDNSGSNWESWFD